MKRLLLTGGNGFIGRHCLLPLLERGFEVHATCRTPRCGQAGVVWHQADLLDPASAAAVVGRVCPSHLLHLAWDTRHGTYWHSPENVAWVRSSLALVEAFARTGGQRAVLAGTCFEYDASFGLLDEDRTPLAPGTLYGSCKHALHVAAAAFARQIGLPLAWARLFFLYGPGENARRLVPVVIRALLRGEAAPCTHGRQVRDYLFVEDAAAALAALADSDLQGPVNVASAVPLRLADLVQMIATTLGRPELLELGALPARAGDPPFMVAAPGRLQAVLGWAPQVGLREGLERSIRWWRENPLASQEPSR